MKTSRIAFAALVAAAVAGGCNKKNKTEDTAAAPVNSKCPMMGEPIEAGSVAQYKGQTVGFCCDSCIPKWTKLSDAEKDAALAKAK